MSEIPETPIIKAINHSHAATAVLKKIKYAYQLSDKELALDTTESTKVAHENLAFIVNSQWTKTACTALEHSQLGKEKLCEVKQIALAAMNALSNALHVRKNVYCKPETHMREAQQRFYSYKPHRKKIVDSYINHLTNDLFDKLCGMGMDNRSARCVTGISIRGAIGSYQSLYQTGERVEIIIRPELQHTRNKTLESLAEEQATMQTYWRRMRDEMLAIHRVSYSPTR